MKFILSYIMKKIKKNSIKYFYKYLDNIYIITYLYPFEKKSIINERLILKYISYLKLMSTR